jgi:hypothetical protein
VSCPRNNMYFAGGQLAVFRGQGTSAALEQQIAIRATGRAEDIGTGNLFC